MQAGTCRATIQNAESGRFPPDLETLLKLTVVLGEKFTFQVGDKVVTVKAGRS